MKKGEIKVNWEFHKENKKQKKIKELELKERRKENEIKKFHQEKEKEKQGVSKDKEKEINEFLKKGERIGNPGVL